MKHPFKINFQLFSDSQYSEDDIALFNALGLDSEGNPLPEGNQEDNPNGPLNIDEESDVTPDMNPANLPDSPIEAEASNLTPEEPETDSLMNPGNEPALTGQPPLILGKFKNQAELERAYQEQQNFLGRQSTEIGELRKRLNETNAPQTPPAGGDGLFDGVSNEQLLAAFARDPKQFLRQVMSIANSDTLNQAKRELRAESEKEKYLKEFFEQNPDFEDMKDDFLMISDEIKNPEYAINIIRGRKLGNLENLFSDTAYLKKHLDSPGMKEILSDVSIAEKLGEKVIQKIIDENLKKVKESQSNVTLITNALGAAPKAPPKKYENFQDMSDDVVAYINELGKKS